MKKMTLIAASVALALTGCNDDNGNSNSPQSNTTQITAFDGYFHNAVVFNDLDKDGVLDIDSDTIFGLTDINGQITIPAGQTGFLALQTLTLGGPVQTALQAKDSSRYTNIYTIDSDHPEQSVANEVVFRAPASADVISPITDLVAIKMTSGATEEVAIAEVNQKLGLDDSSTVTVYSDFVEAAATNDDAAELHKTAQILTSTKGQSPEKYEQNTDKIVEDTVKVVDEIVDNGGDIRDPDFKPVIDPDGENAPVTNFAVVVDKEKSQNIESILVEPYSVGNPLDLFVNIDDLFTDKDHSDSVSVSLTEDSVKELTALGITAKVELIDEDFTKLSLIAEELKTAGTANITLSGVDLDKNGEVTGKNPSVTYKFTVNPPVPNEQPVPNADVLANLNTEAQNWAIKEGVQFSQTLDITSLFTDPESDSLIYEASVRNNIGLTAVVVDGVVTVSGIPANIVADRNEAFYIYAWDGQHGTGDGNAIKVEIKLPAIELAPVAPTHELEDKNLYFVEFETDNRSYPEGDITCSTLLLDSTAKFAYTSSNEDNLKECQTTDIRTKLGSYEINEQGVITIHESSDYTEDEKSYDITMEVLRTFDNDNGKIYQIESSDKEVGSDDAPYVGAMEVFTSVDDIQFYAKSDAACVEGNDACGGRYKKHISPSIKTEGEYILRTVGYQLEQTISHQDGAVTLDADIYFDSTDSEEVLTCQQLTNIYGAQFFLTYSQNDQAVTKIVTENNGDLSSYCFTATNDAGEAEGVKIDFDITLDEALTVGSIVSFAILPSDSYDKKLSEIGINMEWTGQGNND